MLSAAGVKEGIDALKKAPKCILIDVTLPDGGGSEVLAEARRRAMPVKVIVLVGEGVERFDLLVEVAEYKPDYSLVKPVNCSELIEWLEDNCP